MNRIHAALILLALLAAFAVFGHLAVQHTADTLEEGLTTLAAQVDAQEYDAARAEVARLQRLCNEKEGLLTLFVKRDLVNTLCICLQGVDAYLCEDYRSDALLEIARARAQVTALRRQYFDFA